MILSSVPGKLSIFGTTWVCESAFSTANFTKSKFRSSISDEDLASKLSCAVSVKHSLDFKDLVRKKECNNLPVTFYTD